MSGDASLRTSKAKWRDPRIARAHPSSCIANRRSIRRRRHREPVSSRNVRRRRVARRGGSLWPPTHSKVCTSSKYAPVVDFTTERDCLMGVATTWPNRTHLLRCYRGATLEGHALFELCRSQFPGLGSHEVDSPGADQPHQHHAEEDPVFRYRSVLVVGIGGRDNEKGCSEENECTGCA